MNFKTNGKGRAVPTNVPGWGKFRAYKSPFSLIDEEPLRTRGCPAMKAARPGETKVTRNLKDAIERSGLRDGMTSETEMPYFPWFLKPSRKWVSKT